MKTIDVRNELKTHPTRKYARRRIDEISVIAIHHSLTTSGSPQAFANYHVDSNGWPGIGYSYVIGKDGTVYVCNDLETVSYHVGNSNRKSLGICLVGDFRSEQPTEEQYKSTLELIRYLLYIIPNAEIKGHSELPGYFWKACPVIPMDKLRQDVSRSTIEVKHTRVRWTSQNGVEFAPLIYKSYPASEGWTDIRYACIPKHYQMDLVMGKDKTVPELSQGYELGINGPFFWNGVPIGYVVKDGILMNDTVSAQKWADFVLYQDGRMEITQLDRNRLEGIKCAFTSTPRIVLDGQIHVDNWAEGTPQDVVQGRRPRTAIGLTEDQQIIVAVVDGDSRWDAGLRIDELAAVMIKLGAKQALNLDGGGSSCMVSEGKAISAIKGTRKGGAALVFKRV